METLDLELMREVFRDVRLHIGIGVVTQLGLAPDMSCLRVQVNLMPENREIVAVMGWAACGANAGFYSFPEVNDLMIVAFVEGEPDDAYVICCLPSAEETIPKFAADGHMVAYANTGKKLYLGSDTKILLGRPDQEPTEPVVLGTAITNFFQDFINAFLNAAQIGQSAVGPVALDPSVRQALMQAVQKYITTPSTSIVSSVVFVDRGPSE